MKWIQASSYAIQPTKEKKLVIEVPALKSKVENPVLIYDNGEHALLYRNSEESMVLDYVHPRIRESLYQSQEVAVCEFDIEEDGVTSFYNVPVKQVTSIPVKLFESKTTL